MILPSGRRSRRRAAERRLMHASAGDVKDRVRVFGLLVQRVDGLRCWKAKQLDLAALGLPLQLVHHRERTQRTCSDHEPAAFPGNLLFDGKGCVTEVVAEGLRGFLFPLTHLASINYDVVFVGDPVDSDRAKLECFEAHGTVAPPTSLA